MCSFLFSSIHPADDGFYARLRLRGPDRTKSQTLGGYFFCHNLLSMRGDFVIQPFVSEDETLAILFNGVIYNCPESYAAETR